MSVMNKFIFLVALLASTVIGYFIGSQYNSAPAGVAINGSEVPSSEMPANIKEQNKQSIQEMSDKIAALELQLKYANSQYEKDIHENRSKEEKTVDATTKNTSAEAELELLRQEIEAQKHMESLSTWLEEKRADDPSFNIGVEMQSRFNQEYVDYDWANDQEAKLRNIFSEKESLSAVPLNSAFCKTTQCQLKLGTTDSDASQEILLSVAQALGNNQNTQIIIDDQTQYNELTLYISRHEEGFELD